MKQIVISAGFIFLMGVAPLQAAELVLFEATDCEWCEIWDEEIGEIYPLTDEARIAPLRRIDIYETRPDDLANIRPVMFTPTFVLMENGQEIGRIVGYPGEDFFWAMLQMEMVKLPGDPLKLTRLTEPGAGTTGKQGE